MKIQWKYRLKWAFVHLWVITNKLATNTLNNSPHTRIAEIHNHFFQFSQMSSQKKTVMFWLSNKTLKWKLQIWTCRTVFTPLWFCWYELDLMAHLWASNWKKLETFQFDWIWSRHHKRFELQAYQPVVSIFQHFLFDLDQMVLSLISLLDSKLHI